MITPTLPSPRGRVTDQLFSALVTDPGVRPLATVASGDCDPLSDEDLQLALYCCYELHYRGFDGVSDHWEWEPSRLALRMRLEAAFEGAVREAVGPFASDIAPNDSDTALRASSHVDGRSLSTYLSREGTRDQML